MTISIGSVWHVTDVTDSDSTFTLSGTATTAGSALVIWYGNKEGLATPTITTPAGYTSQGSHVADGYLYYKLNAASISTIGLAIATGTDASPVSAILVELKSSAGGFQLDGTTSVLAQGSATTTQVSNGLTTTLASAGNNTICLGFVAVGRNNVTAITWSSPTNSYAAVTGAYTSGNDGTVGMQASAYSKTISANVSGQTFGVTASASSAYTATAIAFNELSVSGGIMLGGMQNLSGIGGTYFRNPIG